MENRRAHGKAYSLSLSRSLSRETLSRKINKEKGQLALLTAIYVRTNVRGRAEEKKLTLCSEGERGNLSLLVNITSQRARELAQARYNFAGTSALGLRERAQESLMPHLLLPRVAMRFSFAYCAFLVSLFFLFFF